MYIVTNKLMQCRDIFSPSNRFVTFLKYELYVHDWNML